MRKINESKFKNNKGITLIALVVTIVVSFNISWYINKCTNWR